MSEETLANIIDQESLKWIFVGGKGGVGKTTTSCCLGVKLAEKRKSVLIVSTDPAHNLSDAFNQKFSRVPTLVEGFTNLYCMEIDAAAAIEEESSSIEAAAAMEDPSGAAGAAGSTMSKLMKEFSNTIPGIDEAMSFMELMKHMKRMEFDVTVFDTAPTGHTLRLLALPGTLDRALGKLMGLRERFGGMLSAVQGMFGGPGGAAAGMPPVDQLFGKLDEMRTQVDSVQRRLRNPDESTFVCVCIPEFLSLFETERLVQELTRYEIDTHNVVVNQVLFVEDDSTCKRCLARKRMQGKYLDQIADLYDGFSVVKTPLLNEEVRGSAKLRAFGQFLTDEPYSLASVLPAVLCTEGPAGVGAAGASGGAGSA